MEESERLWRIFLNTGRPEDYLRYVRTLRRMSGRKRDEFYEGDD